MIILIIHFIYVGIIIVSMHRDKIIIDGLVFNKYIKQKDIDTRTLDLSDELNKYYEDKNPLIIGVLNGCIYFMMDLLKNTTFEYSLDFIKATSYAGMKRHSLSLDLSINRDDCKNKYILIVEDIIDSGKTILNICKKIREYNPKNVKIVSLLTRIDTPFNKLNIDWYGFKIENKYVFGYGLDYNNLFRNLKDIYKLNEK